MLISLARRKPRAVGAVPGEEGAACSWKTALWAWSASAAGGQGPETAGKEASPSPALQPPSSGRGRPACAGAGATRAAAVPDKADTSSCRGAGVSEHSWQRGWAQACQGQPAQGPELRQREGSAGAGVDRWTNTDTVGREARWPGSCPTLATATLPVQPSWPLGLGLAWPDPQPVAAGFGGANNRGLGQLARDAQR